MERIKPIREPSLAEIRNELRRAVSDVVEYGTERHIRIAAYNTTRNDLTFNFVRPLMNDTLEKLHSGIPPGQDYEVSTLEQVENFIREGFAGTDVCESVTAILDPILRLGKIGGDRADFKYFQTGNFLKQRPAYWLVCKEMICLIMFEEQSEREPEVEQDIAAAMVTH